MKFSTPPFTVFLLALAATMSSLNSLTTVSAKSVFFNENNSNGKSHESERKSTSQKLEIPVSPFVHSPNSISLVLYGLDPTETLSKPEASFLHQTPKDVFAIFPEEDGIDLATRSVSLHDNIAVPEGNKRFLRGRRNRPNKGKHIWSDHEMCEYQDGPLKGQTIPDCEFDIFLYRDHYCHNCDDDGWRLWITDFPSSSPSTDPYADYFDDFVDDYEQNGVTSAPSQSPSKWTYQHWNNDDVPNMTRHPSSSPSLVPTKAPTPAPINADVKVERGPRNSFKNPSQRISKKDIEICKRLKESDSALFKRIKKCRIIS